MTATPSPKGVEPKEPEPTIEQLQQTYLKFCELRARGMWTPLETVIVMYRGNSSLEQLDNTHLKALFELSRLTAERDEAQKRAEAAEAERDELANWIKRIRGQAESAMASLHGEKLETDLEVAPTA